MTCPTCGADTITTPNGTHLNPTPSRVGRYLPDGHELTPTQQRDRTIRGYLLHHCPINPTPPQRPAPEQTALF